MTTFTGIREVIVPKPGGQEYGPGVTPGVKAGGLLFFSAIRGHGPGGVISDDTREQTIQAFENLKLLLEGAGATLDHVAKVTLYLHDLKYRAAFHEVWEEYFPIDPPAKIGVQVANANVREEGRAHFALDVIAVAP